MRSLKNIFSLLIVLPAFLGAVPAFGQGEGEIEKVEIEIVKERQIVLPQATRNFEKVPPRPVEPIKPEITYQFKELSFRTPDFNPSIRPLRLKDQLLSKIYGNYISAGFGNYSSPYAEAYVTNKRDKSKFYGAKFFHRSFMNGPVDNGNSGSGNTELRLFGKGVGEAITTQGFLQYENQAGHFYGYTLGKDISSSSIRQDYNVFSGAISIENSKVADFNYHLQGGYSHLSDHYSASENELSLNFASDFKIDKESKFILQADYFKSSNLPLPRLEIRARDNSGIIGTGWITRYSTAQTLKTVWIQSNWLSHSGQEPQASW